MLENTVCRTVVTPKPQDGTCGLLDQMVLCSTRRELFEDEIKR